MIYLLSLIAELIRENPKFYFPFTRKFLLTVFRIDYEMLQHSQLKKDILAILSVVYENFSRQRRLVVKYKLAAQLKTSLLENFSLIEEIFTLKIFNKAICNLTAQGVLFTSQEFAKYGILETLSMFIQRNQAKLLMSKLRLDELTVSKARQDHMERIEEETGDAEDSMKEDNELSSMESK